MVNAQFRDVTEVNPCQVESEIICSVHLWRFRRIKRINLQASWLLFIRFGGRPKSRPPDDVTDPSTPVISRSLQYSQDARNKQVIDWLNKWVNMVSRTRTESPARAAMAPWGGYWSSLSRPKMQNLRQSIQNIRTIYSCRRSFKSYLLRKAFNVTAV